MPLVAAAVLLACVLFALLVWSRRERWERPPELDEAIERIREQVRRPPAVIGGAVLVALVLVAAMVRNPSRWALLLVALAALAVAVGVYVVRERRR